MALLICERTFEPSFTEEVIEEMKTKLGPCLDMNGVRWIESHLSTDRKRMICHYEAADAEAVRRAQRAAGVVFDRVWPVLEVLRPPSA